MQRAVKRLVLGFGLCPLIVSLILSLYWGNASGDETGRALGKGLKVLKTRKGPEYKEGELLVRFKKGASKAEADRVHQTLGAQVVKRFKRTSIYHVQLKAGMAVKEGMKRYKGFPSVEYAVPNGREYLLGIPNDPNFGDLWGLHNTGQTGGMPDADIDAPEAWEIQTGSPNVVVAVVDTGIDYDHPDLVGNIWTNPEEIPGNGIDDDGNGYVDDVYGIDTANDDPDPSDGNGHGTHVSGTIGAVGNNNVGVVGVNWRVKIMALKAFDDEGYAYLDDILEILEYLLDMKARGVNVKVSSNSWGGGGYNQALYDAIAALRDAGILFVAAAGNSSEDNDQFLNYPSSYDLENIIAVSATNHDDGLAYFSSWGATSVDVGAPGEDILSTVPTWWNPPFYDWFSGTSMATPHASGLAALILAQHPADTARQVKNLILNTVDPIPALAGMVLTGGRINAHNALTCDNSVMRFRVNAPGEDFQAIRRREMTVMANLTTCVDPIAGATVTVAPTNGDPSFSLHDDGVDPDQTAGDGIYSGTWNPGHEGEVTLNFAASAPGFGTVTGSVSGEVIVLVNYAFKANAAYEWKEACDSGFALFLGDDDILTLGLPFDVKFYGESGRKITVSDNGAVNFTGEWIDYVNSAIPSAGNPSKMAAALWDDLDPSAGGHLCVDILGEAPNRIFVVAWKDIPHYEIGGAVTFEMLFYEGSSKVKMQYQDVIFGDAAYDGGASATVGAQYDGITGTQYSYNTARLSNGQAILFFPAPTFFVATNGSTFHPGDTLVTTLVVENAGDPIRVDAHVTVVGPPPIGGPIPLLDVLGVTLPDGFEIEIPLLPPITLDNPPLPFGTYTFRAWFNEPHTPDVISDETTSITFSP